MRRIEAIWVGQRLSCLSADSLSPVLEIGASSLHFRTVLKPHIEQFVYGPLRDRGVRVVTSDLRDQEGVDIVGDVFDPNVQKHLREVGAGTLLMCNLLEHIRDPQSFAAVSLSMVRPGGRLIVTVPRDFPYHLDPIDTMFRPDVPMVHAMFPGCDVEAGEILVDPGYWSDLREKHGRIRAGIVVLAELLRALSLRGGKDRALSRIAKLRYLSRPYKITAVVLKLPDRPGGTPVQRPSEPGSRA